jgi:hypothetical protein
LANLNGRTFPLMGQREERPSAFGGIRRDVGWLTSVSKPVNLLFAVDLPVSLVADAITLPAVKIEQVRWDAEHAASNCRALSDGELSPDAFSAESRPGPRIDPRVGAK